MSCRTRRDSKLGPGELRCEYHRQLQSQYHEYGEIVVIVGWSGSGGTGERFPGPEIDHRSYSLHAIDFDDNR